MEWLKNHTDSVATIATIVGAVIWMNGKFNDIDLKFSKMTNEIDHRFSNLEKDMAIIKTVLVMKEILPKELATVE